MAGPERWGDLQFQEVRAYLINWNEKYNTDSLFNAGQLNEERSPKNGVRLTQAHLARLKNAITEEHPEEGQAYCFYPHHAFAFFNPDGDVVAHLDVCFECGNHMESANPRNENEELMYLA